MPARPARAGRARQRTPAASRPPLAPAETASLATGWRELEAQVADLRARLESSRPTRDASRAAGRPPARDRAGPGVGRELLGCAVTAAQKIATAREGRVAFALIDADGKLHERGGR